MTNTFTLDFENTFEGGGIKDGIYEVVITKMAEDATPSGAEHIDCRLTVRNDIQQSHQNQIVFHKMWKSKKDGKYFMPAFNTMGKAAQLQKGKTYTSLDDLLKDFIGKPVKVTVKNETSEYNGKTYENLNVKRWETTDFPQVVHKFKTEDGQNPFAQPTGAIEIDDSSMPF